MSGFSRILAGLLVVAISFNSTASFAMSNKKEGHFEYQPVLYSTTRGALIRQVTDTKRLLTNFEFCHLARTEEGDQYSKYITVGCRPMSNKWVPATDYHIQVLNQTFSENFAQKIKERQDQVGYMTVALFAGALSFGGISKFFADRARDINHPKQGLAAKFGGLSLATTVLLIVATVLTATRFFPPSIEATLERLQPHLDEELQALGDEILLYAPLIFDDYDLAIRKTMHQIGIYPDA